VQQKIKSERASRITIRSRYVPPFQKESPDGKSGHTWGCQDGKRNSGVDFSGSFQTRERVQGWGNGWGKQRFCSHKGRVELVGHGGKTMTGGKSLVRMGNKRGGRTR